MTAQDHLAALGDLLYLFFLMAWIIALGGWGYAFWHFMPMWSAGFQKREHHKGYARKVLIGTGIFIGALAVGFGAMWSIERLGL